MPCGPRRTPASRRSRASPTGTQFSFIPKTSFKKAAQRTVDAARALYDEPTAQTVIAQFQARGINGLV
jgi:hypothetical protein